MGTFHGATADDFKSCITLRTRSYGNYGIFLVMGNAGFISRMESFNGLVVSCRNSKLQPGMYSVRGIRGVGFDI